MNDPVIRPIPLDRLELSPANVRRTDAGKAAFAELKASIAAHGLLENLVAHPIVPGQDGVNRYAVIAGGSPRSPTSPARARSPPTIPFPAACSTTAWPTAATPSRG